MWLVGTEKHRLRLSKKLSQENSVYFSLKGRHLPCFKSVSAKRALDFQLKLECTGMLIDFKVANFRSIAEPLTFSMQGSKASKASIETGSNAVPYLLRAAAIFRANGSGKTNLLMAAEVLHRLLPVERSEECRVGKEGVSTCSSR